MLIDFNPCLWEVDPNFQYSLAFDSKSAIMKNKMQAAVIGTLTNHGAIFSF